MSSPAGPAAVTPVAGVEFDDGCIVHAVASMAAANAVQERRIIEDSKLSKSTFIVTFLFMFLCCSQHAAPTFFRLIQSGKISKLRLRYLHKSAPCTHLPEVRWT